MALRMKADECLFLIVDVQEKLAQAMSHKDEVISINEKLVKVAKTLFVPHLVTEQYPQGIGGTVESLLEHVDQGQIVEKMTFSCMLDDGFKAALKKIGKKKVVVCGMEAHVCVLQTVLDLLDGGYSVFVVEDGISSRTIKNKMLAVERMRQAGAQIVSSEMVMFEWLERAGTPDFKAVLPLIK